MSTIHHHKPSISTLISTEWKQDTPELRRQRAMMIITIRNLLRTGGSTFSKDSSKFDELSMKIERILFLRASSRETYENKQTIRIRVKLVARHLLEQSLTCHLARQNGAPITQNPST